jgi:Ca-activated chloride channel family protein
MKSKISSKFVIIAIALTALFLVSGCSPTAEKLNQDGNESFKEQAFDEAQLAYASAAEEDPELAEPYYNLANTLYRKGGFDQAIQFVQQALSLTMEEGLAQNGLYNLGHNTFNMQDFGTAVEAYKQALLLNPDDQDAKYNLELALQQQQEQEQQEQEQNQDSESEEEQEQEQNQDSQSEDQQDQREQGDEPQDQQDGKSESEQEQNSDQAEEEQNQGEGQPQEGEGENQPWEAPQPGEKMTEEQAKQLLAALIQNSQTLSEKLGQILFVRDLPPIQDW